MSKKLKQIFITTCLLILSTSANSCCTDMEDEGCRSSRPLNADNFKLVGEYYNAFKERAENNKATTEQIKTLWDFRYLKGVDQKVLEEHAKKLNITLDHSLSSKLLAWRLYFGHEKSGRFYATKLPWVTATASIFSFLVFSLAGPIHVPDDCTIAYGFISKIICGGEAGPACPSTKLAASLPKKLMFMRSVPHGLAILASVNMVVPILIAVVTMGTSQDAARKQTSFKTVEKAQKYLRAKDKTLREARKGIAMFGVLTLGANVIGIPAILEDLSGKLVHSMRDITFSEYSKRPMIEGCYQIIDKITALPCNVTLPWSYMQDVNVKLFTITTMTTREIIFSALPYMIPTFLTLFQFMIFMLKLV